MNWIKVENRLPEVVSVGCSRLVLLRNVRGRYFLGHMDILNKKEPTFYDTGANRLYEITHWAEITPPKD